MAQNSSRELSAAATRVEEGTPLLEVATVPPATRGRLRLAVLKLDHLGDFILALPALRKLRAEFPHDEITLVCGSWNKSLAESIGIFDHVLTHDLLSRDRRPGQGRELDPIAGFKSLLSGIYDIAIDLRPEGDTRFLLGHIKAEKRMGFGPLVDHPFLDVALPFLPAAEWRQLHTRRAYGPERFSSRVPGNDLYLETNFGSTDNIIVYGPYAPLPVGDHTVTFHFSAVGLGRRLLRSSIEFDIVQNMVVLARRRLGFWGGGRHLRKGSIAIPISNRDPDGLFEFRTATRGVPFRGVLRFFGVTVESTDPRKESDTSPGAARLHRGELMSLLVQLAADRSHAPARFRPPRPETTAPAPFTAEPGTIVIAPLSHGATRDWPLSYYSELVRLVLAKLDRPIVLIGAAEQANALNGILREHNDHPRLHNLAGRMDWHALPSLFAAASAVVANQSGIAHFAAASGAPLVVIFSGSHRAAEWGPKGENTVVMLRMDVPCSPCGFERLEDCKHDHRCMRSISPASVFAELSRLVAAHGEEAHGS